MTCDEFDQKYDHYNNVRKDLGLSSVWSLFDVANLSERHPFSDAQYVSYDHHWGSNKVSCKINGNTWTALYVAADACIRDSGDSHHIFIEMFCPSADGQTLMLHTGS